MKAIKAIRIILLILIILGIAALATQKLWVPKLVQHIIQSEGQPAVVPATRGATPVASGTPVTHSHPAPFLQDGQQCYSYSHAATSTEPYAVQEFLTLNVHGSAITGTKTGTQSGPDMTNGYTGTLQGTVAGDTIKDTFSYVIEGAANAEQELYAIKPDQTGIEKLRYPLKEAGKVLVPDTSKPFTRMLYARVGCSASN